jgi:5-hydroxyisourate hydrolase
MSTLTSHVLDTATGEPAKSLRVRLSVLGDDGRWKTLSERVTNEDGRVTDLLAGAVLEARTYRLTFDTLGYFEGSGRPVFYPHVDVVFVVSAPATHHHIPLLLSPFGYSTYRGS